MDHFGNRARRPTDLNRAAHPPDISAVLLTSLPGLRAGTALNAAPNLLDKWLTICSVGSLAALRPSPCWATTGSLPWDQTLTAVQDMLVGPIAHALIVLAFVGAGFLYAVGGYDRQAARLAASGIGGCVALGAIRLLNFVFP